MRTNVHRLAHTSLHGCWRSAQHWHKCHFMPPHCQMSHVTKRTRIGPCNDWHTTFSNLNAVTLAKHANYTTIRRWLHGQKAHFSCRPTVKCTKTAHATCANCTVFDSHTAFNDVYFVLVYSWSRSAETMMSANTASHRQSRPGHGNAGPVTCHVCSVKMTLQPTKEPTFQIRAAVDHADKSCHDDIIHSFKCRHTVKWRNVTTWQNVSKVAMRLIPRTCMVISYEKRRLTLPFSNTVLCAYDASSSRPRLTVAESSLRHHFVIQIHSFNAELLSN